jgi:hypothetical protein
MTQPIDTTHLDQMIEENRILRRRWTDWQKSACLLAALVPACGKQQTWMVCPTEVMPLWLAALTPHIDDHVSDDVWPTTIRRYADVAKCWYLLDAASWRRVLLTVLLKAMDIALPYDRGCSCAAVAELLREQSGADDPRWVRVKTLTRETRVQARKAKDSVWDEVTWAASAAASAATYVADKHEPEHEAAATRASETEITTTKVAWAAGKAATWDLIADSLLTALETEVRKVST